MTRWHIYVLMDATGAKRYVGCAIDLSNRLSQHRATKAWFVNHEIVDVCTDSWDARESEIRWIQRVRAEGAILENQRHNRLSSKGDTHSRRLTRERRHESSGAEVGVSRLHRRPQAWFRPSTRHVSAHDLSPITKL